MKLAAEFKYEGERYSCACRTKIKRSFKELRDLEFRCDRCAEPILCEIKAQDGEAMTFMRLPAHQVSKGNVVMVGHPLERQHHEVLGISELKSALRFGLKGYGPFYSAPSTLICVHEFAWL